MYGKSRRAMTTLVKAFAAQSKFDRQQVQESCAALVYAAASRIGSQTEKGKLLREVAEDIRDGKWKDHKVYAEEIL